MQPELDRSHWIMYCQICLYTKLANRNNWTLNNIRGPSIYVVITAVWTVLVNSCNLELQHFKIFNDWECNWHLKYMLDVQSFINPCEDGTLVLKHFLFDM